MFRRLNLLDVSLRQQCLILAPAQGWFAGIDFPHRDAAVDRTNQATQVATHAGILFDSVNVDPIAAGAGEYFQAARAENTCLVTIAADELAQGQGVAADRLVGAVLAGDVA